jgi:hypothetical protein
MHAYKRGKLDCLLNITMLKVTIDCGSPYSVEEALPNDSYD